MGGSRVGQRAEGQRWAKRWVLLQVEKEGSLNLCHSIEWRQREMEEVARYFVRVWKGPNSHPIVWGEETSGMEDDSQV